MENVSNFLIHLSVLHRNIQKYFDKALAQYEIGSGQLMFLFYINEHEGISMQELTHMIEVDKGTTTKSIQKLIEENYIQARTDKNDRRVRRLYTTQKTAEIMNILYEYRNVGRSLIAQDIDFEQFSKLLEVVCRNARNYLVHEEKAYRSVKIGVLQKLSLNAYPNRMSTVIYTAGCNYKCSFCNQKNLVFVPEFYHFIEVDEVMKYLKKRKPILDAVCFSGGEPLIQEGLEDFIYEIKQLGYDIKIDTNGSDPIRLKALIDKKLIDYVALDIKNCPKQYAKTIGMNTELFNLENVQHTIDLLRSSDLKYEFCTTVIKEFHQKDDLIALAKWIQSDTLYYLQQYKESQNVIQSGFTAYSYAEMMELQTLLKPYLPQIKLRGIKEE